MRQKSKINKLLPYGKQSISRSDVQEVKKTLKSNLITQGPLIEKFENKFAKFVDSKYAVACSSGTAALHLSCLALNINHKSKVVTSSITFIASANCAEYLNSKVDFVDVDKETYCICPYSLEKKLKKKKIDLVIVVHLSGHCADMEKIYLLKKKYKFKIIEDACHGLGGKYHESKIGSCKYSDISTFSFHPVKSITTGEGGMITTNNKDLYEKLKIYRSHGIIKSKKLFKNKKVAFEKSKVVNRWYYEVQNIGYNYRMTDIQAALGISQLKRLKKFIKKRNKLADFYIKNFKKNKNIKLIKKKIGIYHSYHLFTLLINFKKIKKSRNKLMSELYKNNIGTQVLYIPIFLQPYYKKKYKFKAKDFPVANDYYSRALSIPIFFDLKLSEQKYIVDKINFLTS